MDDYQLLIDLHKNAERQGPGGDLETQLALNLSRIDKTAPLKLPILVAGRERQR